MDVSISKLLNFVPKHGHYTKFKDGGKKTLILKWKPLKKSKMIC